MNGKAVFHFTMAALCVMGAIGYAADGVKALRGDVWADAMRQTPNHTNPDAPPVTVKKEAEA